MREAFFVCFLCCLQFASHQAEKGSYAREMTAVAGCGVVISSLYTKDGVRVYNISPSVLSVGRRKLQGECTVVKSTVSSAAAPLSGSDVTARFVAPDSEEGRKWRLNQPVIAVHLPEKFKSSRLRVWMNCSLLGNPTGSVWEVLEACPEEQLQDQSDVFLRKLRMRRHGDTSQDRQEVLHNNSVWGWKHGVVVTVALLLSFTIILALCAKKRSLDVTSDENSTVGDAETGAKQIEVDPVKVDGTNGKVDKMTEGEEEKPKELLNETNVSENGKQTGGEVDTSEQIKVEAANGVEERQDHVDSTVESGGMSGSGTMTVPREEMFSGDGYARVRAFSENADRMLSVGESDSSEDEGPPSDGEGDKMEDKAVSSKKSPDLERREKRGYARVSGGSPTQLKLKLKSTPVVSEALPPARSLRGTQLRFGSTMSNTSPGRAPAVPPGERGSPLTSRSLLSKEGRHSQVETDIEMKRDSQSDPQAETDLYSEVDKTSKEDPYSKADTMVKEDDAYSSIEETRGSAGQQPPPLPPINKLPKSPSAFETGKKLSRDEPLPPTPLDFSDKSERVSAARQDFSSSIVDRGRSYTSSDAVTGPKEESPYAKPFARSQSQKVSSSGEGIRVADLSELYSKVDITKKKRNMSASEQHPVQPVQNVDDLYAKPFKLGKGAPLVGASSRENTVTARLAEDGYSCVTKRSRKVEPNYSEVGPAARSSPSRATNANDYASVGDVLIGKLPDIPDPGYEKVGEGSEVMGPTKQSDPGYDSVDVAAIGHTRKQSEPDYENVDKVRHTQDGDDEEEGEQSDSRDEAGVPSSQEPNYDEIDDTFREQIEQYRQRSNSRDSAEDTGL